MSVDLKAIKERLAKATQGAWWVERGLDVDQVRARPSENYSVAVAQGCAEEDAEFIAHAPGDLSALVSEVESLRALLREVTTAAEAVSDDHGPVEDEECDHCALMWRRLNETIERAASAIREEP
jgi:hypothetical protein